MGLKQKVLSKIDEIGKYLEEIEDIKPDSLNEYKDSIEKKRACERILQILIEAAIDIDYLIYKDKGLGIPKDDLSVIEELFKKKVINKEIKESLLNLNGFRNILVHKYGTVDDELVFENLKENLGDFQTLKEWVQHGINLQIVGYDAYPVTDTLWNHYLDTSTPFGHELVLYTLLTESNPEQYPWNLYRLLHPNIYRGIMY